MSPSTVVEEFKNRKQPRTLADCLTEYSFGFKNEDGQWMIGLASTRRPKGVFLPYPATVEESEEVIDQLRQFFEAMLDPEVRQIKESDFADMQVRQAKKGSR